MSFNTPGLEESQPNDHNLGLDMASQSYQQLDSHFPDWSLESESPPPFVSSTTEAHAPDPNCLFRGQVLDECYQSRFWARALEFYLLNNRQHCAPYRCLLASCPERDFKDPKEMLRHMKQCEHFSKGQFWCPICQKNDSFKVVSKTRCSWNRVNFGRRLMQKSKKVLMNFTANGFGAPQASGTRLCINCQAPLYGNYPPQMMPTKSDVQYFGPTTPTAQFWELAAPETAAIRFELPGQRNTLCQPPYSLQNEASISQAYDHQVEPSELSSASMSGAGNSSDISPASFSHSNKSPITGLQDSESMHNITNRQRIEERCTIIPNDPWAQVVDPLNAQTFATLSTPPPTIVRQNNRRRDRPLSLRLDTRSVDPNLPPHNWPFMLSEGNQALGASVSFSNPEMTDLLPGILASPPIEGSNYNAYHGNDDNFGTDDNTNLGSSPKSAPSFSNSDTSPSSMSSSQDMQCPYPNCDFKPSGKIKNWPAYLRKHMKKHEGHSIPCEFCGRTFTRQDNLTNHLRKVHSVANECASKRRRGSSESLQSLNLPKRKSLNMPRRKEVLVDETIDF
ncbi:hypothetical protein F5Y19DRAFT_222877 [Xylariaceae sp. FL1651]|nr:hypothetical protein F5Y19DRAFT_222877 [Xylariaceae sp. FL1651]